MCTHLQTQPSGPEILAVGLPLVVVTSSGLKDVTTGTIGTVDFIVAINEGIVHILVLFK